MLYLIGDAGAPDPSGEPVLTALADDLREQPSSVARQIVFLGDNIYPSGLPSEMDPDRAEAEARILGQVQVAVSTSTPTVFVPGNHDWDDSGPDGWEAVRRQERLVEAAGEGFVTLLPGDGCPGPSILDPPGSPVRLVVLDTEWWLTTRPRPLHPESSCPEDSRSEILAGLAAAIEGAGGRKVVVAAHHPLLTGGPHGGHFTIGQHLFPLRDWKSWLWVPLPVIGSLYPLARQNGVTDQDMSGSRYQAMISAMDSVLTRSAPMAYVSGHTHGLEVFDGGDRAQVLVVSGAGIHGHVSSLANRAATLYSASRESGYARFEFERGGRVRLSVILVDSEGVRTEGYAAFLDEIR